MTDDDVFSMDDDEIDLILASYERLRQQTRITFANGRTAHVSPKTFGKARIEVWRNDRHIDDGY